MEGLFVAREQLRKIYADYGILIDKAGQFLLAFLTFWSIGHSIGTMEILMSPLVLILLSLICTLLPLNSIVLVGGVLILAHLYKLSLEITAVTAVIMMIMYILYFRFVPKHAVILLLTPIACALKIPYVMPICLGLVATPISAVSTCCGLVIYYILHYVTTYAAAMNSAEDGDMGSRLSYFVQRVVQNKEMILLMIVFTMVILVVYTIRRQSFSYSWMIAIAAGIIITISGVLIGSMILDVKVSNGWLIIGCLVALAVAMLLHLLFFSVDYSRSKNLQFEDDEYYYYVKAIPKLSVAIPEKVVKKIHTTDSEDEEYYYDEEDEA